jgi:hypothetical protein
VSVATTLLVVLVVVAAVMLAGHTTSKLTAMSLKDIQADVAAAGSGVTATWTWVAAANDILQLVATAVAIVAGIYAIRWHRVRIDRAVRQQRKNDE